MEQKEAEHMNNLASQFSQLKFSIDTLTVSSQLNSQISTPITLGSDKLPFLKSIRSYGSLNVLPNNCKIKIDDKNGEEIFHMLGSLEYSSSNAYYLDQIYIYENGALILNQLNQDVIVIEPSFTVIESEDLSFKIVKLSGIGDRTSASGYGTYPVKTEFLESESRFINDIKNITFYTLNVNAWKSFFEKELSKSFLDFTIDEIEDNKGIRISFFESKDIDLPDLSLIVSNIDIQISPGWGN
jgi:hypothetical protein